MNQINDIIIEMFNNYNSNSSHNSFTADFYYNDFKQLFLTNTNQQEILMIGNLSKFKNRMDKLYYDSLNHIYNNSKLRSKREEDELESRLVAG